MVSTKVFRAEFQDIDVLERREIEGVLGMFSDVDTPPMSSKAA